MAELVLTVPPAHAGIDRRRKGPATYILRFPRTRGDRPHLAVRALVVQLVPPHTRG